MEARSREGRPELEGSGPGLCSGDGNMSTSSQSSVGSRLSPSMRSASPLCWRTHSATSIFVGDLQEDHCELRFRWLGSALNTNLSVFGVGAEKVPSFGRLTSETRVLLTPTKALFHFRAPRDTANGTAGRLVVRGDAFWGTSLTSARSRNSISFRIFRSFASLKSWSSRNFAASKSSSSPSVSMRYSEDGAKCVFINLGLPEVLPSLATSLLMRRSSVFSRGGPPGVRGCEPSVDLAPGAVKTSSSAKTDFGEPMAGNGRTSSNQGCSRHSTTLYRVENSLSSMCATRSFACSLTPSFAQTAYLKTMGFLMMARCVLALSHMSNGSIPINAR